MYKLIKDKILLILSNSNNQKWLLLLLLLIVTFFYFRSCSNKNTEIDNRDWNISVLKDSVTKTSTKNNQLEYEKKMLIATKDNLKLYSDSLYTELIKEKSNVKVIINEKIIYKDTIIYVGINKTKKINDSTYNIDWCFNLQDSSIYKYINGNTIFTINYKRDLINVNSYLTNFEIEMNLITGIKEIEDNKYKIYIRSKDNNPKFKFNLDGAILDDKMFGKKEDYFILGPQVGLMYKDGSIIPTYGLGLTFKFWGF